MMWLRKLARGLQLVFRSQPERLVRLLPASRTGVAEKELASPPLGRCALSLYATDPGEFSGGRFTVTWEGCGLRGTAFEADLAAQRGWLHGDLVVPSITEKVKCDFVSRDGSSTPLVMQWVPAGRAGQLLLLLKGALRRMPTYTRRITQRFWLRQIQARKPHHDWSWDQVTALTGLDRTGMQRHAASEGWGRVRLRLWIDARGASTEAIQATLQSLGNNVVASIVPGVITEQDLKLPVDLQVSSINAAITQTTEEWLTVVPAGALIAPAAGYWLAREFERKWALIYTDAHDPEAWVEQGGMVLAGDFDPELFRETRVLPGLVCARATEVQALEQTKSAAEWMECVSKLVSGHSPAQIGHLDQVLVSMPAMEYVHALPVQSGWERVSTAAGEASLRPKISGTVPRVAVVIPTRDRVDLLHMCVNSLRSIPAGPELEICIADNDSVEAETHAYFARLRADGVQVVPCPGEFNFSRIVNQAVAATTADYVLLLNNDIEVIEPGWLTEMLAHAQRAEIGCVGAKLFFPDGRIQHAGVTIGLGGLAGHPMRFYPGESAGYLNRLNHVQSYRAVTAACLLVRRAVYEQVGGFNETDLAVAYNDVDFCLRVEKAGYRNLWTPHARLVHHEYASRGLDVDPIKAARYARECDYLRDTWSTSAHIDPYYHRLLTRADETCSLTHEPWGPRPWLVTICDDE